MSSAKASQSNKTWTATTNPIPFHPSLRSTSDLTTMGRLYTLSQTAFLLSYYIFRFKALVEDPIRTMIEMLIPMVIAQGIWCCACLPRSGHWEARFKGLKAETETQTEGSGEGKTNIGAGKGSVRRKGGVGGAAGSGISGAKGDGIGSRIVPLIISLVLTTTTLPPIFILLAILLGAPATTHTTHTSLLALHVSLLVGPPLFYTHGVSAQAWREVTCAYLPFDEAGVWGGVIGALVGGWLGAVPIPLDWDREWQKWPVTVLTGVWMGWALGRMVLGPMVLRGKRIDMRETDAWDYEERLKVLAGRETLDGSSTDNSALARSKKQK